MTATKEFWLVDDDADDRMMFAYAVKKADRNLKHVEMESGKALFEKLTSGCQLPDVIFLDINMPRMSGWDCLLKLKQNESTARIPVIMYSTSSEDRDVQKARELGAFSYCVKPDDFTHVKSLLTLVFDNLHKDLETVLACSDLKCMRI